MRVVFVFFVLISSSLSGCFGTEELFEEKRGIPGGLALACLQDDGFERMKIHFLFENGYDPVAMDLLKQIDKVCDKPNGIQSLLERLISKKTTWTANDVRDARWKHGDDAMGSDTHNWYFLFPRGHTMIRS